jgi:hypothetical protein
MGEAKDIQLQQVIADTEERKNDDPEIEDRKIVIVPQYDPDHLKPDQGGNQASDDYW